MDFNPNIFRAYDVRGKYPDEINEKIAFFLAKSFVKFLKEKNKKGKLRIGLGRDGRLSSPSLAKFFLKGLTTENVSVLDFGLCTSPMLYWAANFYILDGAVQITASHLGKEYNGFKMIGKNQTFLGQNTGLEKIKRIFQKEVLKKERFKKKGGVERKSISQEYVNYCLKDFENNFSPLKIVIDTGNAVPGMLIPFLIQKLPFSFYHLFPQIKGSFPSHSPDPIKEENLVFLKKEVKKKKANFGVAFDGDGDRIAFVDEKGKMIPPNLITALIVTKILKQKPFQKIVYDVRTSRIVRETVLKHKGKPLLSRVGHTFIKALMKKEKAIFGAESSGHFYHKRSFYCEDPLFVFLSVCQILQEARKPLSFLISPFRKYFFEEFVLPLDKTKDIFSLLEKKYQRGKKIKIDGLRVDFKEWWFLARPSNTEPVIRFFIEAEDKKILQQKKREIIKIIT